jgi:hypothetical protein
MDILKEVVFVILMQSHDGIEGKAPSYLAEKRQFIDRRDTGDEAARMLLDSKNLAIYNNYKTTWIA